MKKHILLLILFLVGFQSIFAQKQPLTYYIPDLKYNESIPTPEDYLGYQVGEWHVSHDQLVGYMKTLALASDRITIETFARSYENRPLVLLTITSEKNHKNIAEIQKQHQDLCDPSKSGSVNINNLPSIVYQGYTIHGNESSGSNAALLVAYYLAAAPDKEVKELLDNVVILLDPVFNPDGMNRFANWVNVHKSKNLVTDPQSREFEEVWPRGRTNHYWFDLNRDWLPVQHPESQGRIKNFHTWKPNILTDHHEMGSNSTYFFQPGIPSRTNPLTPKKNQELTKEIAKYHAKNLDKIGSLYYSEESFDDFYYGKGSTYPDANGCIGILFEQASSRGHGQDTENGVLTFPFTIRNQVQTSFSTQEAGLKLRKELLEFQRDHYKQGADDAKKDNVKGYVFSGAKDPARTNHLLELLLMHQIEVYGVSSDSKVNGRNFEKGNSYIVPLNQPQYRLAKAMFETRTSFSDSLFYDVSTWTLPLAFNLPYEAYTGGISISKGDLITAVSTSNEQKIVGAKSEYGYLFEWDDYYAPNVLYRLQNAGLITKVATRPFTIQTEEGMKEFDYGTILISNQIQNLSADKIYNIIQEANIVHPIKIYSVQTGLTPSGIDLGSPNFDALKKPSVLLLVGDGVNSYDAGEVWHLLDQRYDMHLSMVETDDFRSTNLDRYTTIVMVDGSYYSLGGTQLKEWVQNGGNLITFKRSASWAANQGLSGIKAKKISRSNLGRRPYVKAGPDYGTNVIGGAIFENTMDLTHPICYGYNDEKLAVFRRGTLFFEQPANAYAAPVIYTSNPLLSGYVSSKNKNLIKNSAGIIVTGVGRGTNISFADNTNFRAFWYGTNKLFANAIFFGDIISGRTTESPKGAPEKKEEDAGDGHGHGHQH